jgi:hypothetical protein
LEDQVDKWMIHSQAKKKIFLYFNHSSLDDALSTSNDSMAVNDELETIWVKVYVA